MMTYTAYSVTVAKGAKARARTADGWGPLRQLDGAIDQGTNLRFSARCRP